MYPRKRTNPVDRKIPIPDVQDKRMYARKRKKTAQQVRDSIYKAAS